MSQTYIYFLSKANIWDVIYDIWDVINIFEVKLTLEMLTVRGQQHSFLTHDRAGCNGESVKVFKTAVIKLSFCDLKFTQIYD